MFEVIKTPYLYKMVKSNTIKVIDFKKLNKLSYLCNIIISQRGQIGKTFNFKEFLLDEYINYGKTSGWILNTESQWENAVSEFLRLNILESDKWDNVKISRHGLFLDGVRFCRFFALSKAGVYKSNRQVLDYLILDEFNEGLILHRKLQVSNFDSIIHTSTDIHTHKTPKLFIFGNQKTLGTPLLERLEIVEITGEFMVDKSIGTSVYIPFVKDLIEIKKEIHNKIWNTFINFSIRLGTYKSSMQNINVFDNTWGVITWTKLDKENWIDTDETLLTNGMYYKLFTKKNNWYIKTIDKPIEGKNIIYAKKQSAEWGGVYNKDLKEYMLNMLIKERLFFDSISCKLNILKIIK